MGNSTMRKAFYDLLERSKRDRRFLHFALNRYRDWKGIESFQSKSVGELNRAYEKFGSFEEQKRWLKEQYGIRL